ncbi:DNA N-6-adenine-methyltransferase [Azospirillum doebereinerae]
MHAIYYAEHPNYFDEWYTPASEIRVILNALSLDRFDCDPASPGPEISKVPARTHYTRSQDGLAQDWSGVVWINPPYSDKESWLCKAILEVCDSRAKGCPDPVAGSDDPDVVP